MSVSVTAIMLSLTIRLYQRYGSLDIDEILMQYRKEDVDGVCAEFSVLSIILSMFAGIVSRCSMESGRSV